MATTRKLELPLDQHFRLDKTLALNTQDFRWDCWRDDEGTEWHSGVLEGHVIHVRQPSDEYLQYCASGGAEVDKLLFSYFRLDEDIEAVRSALSSTDETMQRLVSKFADMRVLRQPDAWECTVSFICSATNSIRGTRTRVESIADRLGRPMALGSDERPAFPSPNEVVAGGEKLKNLKLGLKRDQKIIAAARRVGSRHLDLNRLSQTEVSYPEARWQLQFCPGVGPKIADCISLFALGKDEAFPVDRWVRDALNRCYFPSGKLPFGDDLVRWGQERFGRNAGYASQLLFLSSYTNSKNP